MKSRMSCFNTAILKRTLFRGLPVWGAYLLCWLIALPVVLLSNGEYQEVVYLKEYILQTAAGTCNVVNFVYGLAVACVVSAYLYKSRSANFFGALPLRREGMFLTQLVGGLCFSILPNVIIVIATLLAGAYWGGNMLSECVIWFAAQSLGFLFYYGFAMLVAMIVGNLIALPLIYGVLNFTAVVVEAIIRELLDIFVAGAWFTSDFLFDRASPLFYVLSSGEGPRVRSNWVEEKFVSATFYNWKMLLIYAAVGIACILIAFWIHKKRRMESAGDVIAVRHLKPVFLYCFTIGCSLCIGYFLASIVLSGIGRNGFVTVLICMLVGAFLGYFAGQMMLHRSVRVFRKQYFVNYGVTALVIVAVLLCVRFDLFGYSRYLPDADDVQAVSIGYNYEVQDLSEDRELIEKTIDFHKVVMQTDEWEQDDWHQGSWGYRSTYLTYRMKDGRMVRRSYDVPLSPELSEDPNSPIRLYEALFNDPDYKIVRELGTDYTAADIEYCSIHNDSGDEVYLTNTEAYEFLKTCIEPDLRETTLGWNDYTNRDVGSEHVPVYLNLQFKDPAEKTLPGNVRVAEYVFMSATKDARRFLDFAAQKGIEP
ncbi:MAG: ABC transporter permease [Oscillospiraceae bacterium]|nr:ABC transporter permease [Oscillospiraceae bacterium]